MYTITLTYPGLLPHRSINDIGYRSSDIPCRKLAIGWYQQCQNHPKCKDNATQNASNFLPDRVIDVGGKGEELIRLHVRDQSEIRYAPFVTLSYSWGEAESIKLSQETYPVLKSGIAARDLPKTFRNAIALVRDMGFRFLWIDSLCIFQDSVEDWQKQAYSMGQIYKRCALSLAATSATDCNGGLFFERDPYMLQPVRVFARWPLCDRSRPMAWYNCFIQAPYFNNIMASHLNTRGWVVQERLLPPRILHCSKRELVWECNKMIATETFPEAILAGRDHNPTDRLVQLLAFMPSERGQDEVHDGWLRVITQYSECNLSREEDVLIAISGVAQEWQNALNDDYLAGLWKNCLHVGLLWYTAYGHDMDLVECAPQRPTLWRAPTWSWASVRGQVQYSRELDPQLFANDLDRQNIPLFDLLDWEIVSKSTSKTCQLLSASIKLRGNLLHASVDFTNTWFPDRNISFISRHGPGSRRVRFDIDGYIYSGEVHFDYPDTVSELAAVSDAEILCLPLLLLQLSPRGSSRGHSEGGFTIEGIVLDLSEDSTKATYERIGHFRISTLQESPQNRNDVSDRPWEGFAQFLNSQSSIDLTIV